MEIKKLVLKNFKVFSSEEFNFKKITILAGANSAGKSTILNAIASILQGSESRPFPFYFSNYGKNVHLGGYKDIITGGHSNQKFSIGVTFGTSGKETHAEGTYRYATNGQQILVDSVMIKDGSNKFSVKWGGQTNGYSAFREISTKNKEKESKLAGMLLSSFSEFLSKVSEDKDKENEKSLEQYIQDMTKSSEDWEPVETKSSKDLFATLNETVSYKVSIGNYKNKFLDLLNNTSYIGPIRPYPSRHYFLSSHLDKMDALGANAFQLLIDWYKSDPKKFKKTTSALKALQLADDLNPDPIKDDLLELNVKPFGQKYSVNLSDVGFGLSQILPVIVANVAAEKGGTLLVNQPEVHLHPSSQAKLGDYFNDESKNRNFIIETHSEYLINRLRLLVAKGELPQENVSIIYIDNGETGPVVSNISIDKSGSLTNAPESFFDTYYIDNSELVFASINDEEDDDE